MKESELKERLTRYRQIKLSVIGRKTGQAISIPVWFLLEGEKLYLLPVQGSDTQWYKNVLKNPSIKIKAGGTEAELKAIPTTDAKQVWSVVEHSNGLRVGVSAFMMPLIPLERRRRRRTLNSTSSRPSPRTSLEISRPQISQLWHR